MDLGMPTLIETGTVEECAALCNQLGLQFIELNMNLPQYQIGRMDEERLKAAAERFGIYYTVHLDENLNVSDFNPYVAEAYLKTVRESIAFCKRLNIPILNMHLSRGVYFTLPNKRVYLFERYADEYRKSFEIFRAMCEEEIGGDSIKICVENSDGYTDFQLRALELLLKSPVFALTFDIGHDHAIGGGDGAFIIRHREKLLHMHFHDALGAKNHLALGDGEIDLPKYFSLAKECGVRIVLETKTVEGLKKSAKAAGRFL